MAYNLQKTKSAQNNFDDFQRISVHCKPGDMGFDFTITVGSPLKISAGKNHKQHTSTHALERENRRAIPPHAHIYIGDRYESRFQIAKKRPPKKLEDLKTVDATDAPLMEIGEDLIKWINAKPKRAISKGSETNWDAMRSAWANIQDVFNKD